MINSKIWFIAKLLAWLYVSMNYCAILIINTVIYQSITMATINFSKQKGGATKQGWLLYKGSHLTFVEYLNSGIYTVLMFQM